MILDDEKAIAISRLKDIGLLSITATMYLSIALSYSKTVDNGQNMSTIKMETKQTTQERTWKSPPTHNIKNYMVTGETLLKPFKNAGKGVNFIVTAYCSCEKCCGHTHGITKSGQHVVSNYTMACDPARLHEIVYLEGIGYRHCTDTGGRRIRGRRLDMYIFSHDEAIRFGVQRVKGYWTGKKWRR